MTEHSYVRNFSGKGFFLYLHYERNLFMKKSTRGGKSYYECYHAFHVRYTVLSLVMSAAEIMPFIPMITTIKLSIETWSLWRQWEKPAVGYKNISLHLLIKSHCMIYFYWKLLSKWDMYTYMVMVLLSCLFILTFDLDLSILFRRQRRLWWMLCIA